MTKSKIGEIFLSEHSGEYRLEIFYDTDGAPHVNLCEVSKAKNGEVIRSIAALDMSSIFEQVTNEIGRRAS